MVYALLNPGGYQSGLQNFGEMLDKVGVRDGSAKGEAIRANGDSEALEMRFLAILWRWVGVGLLVNRGPTFLLAPGAQEFLEQRADEAEVVLHRSGCEAALKKLGLKPPRLKSDRAVELLRWIDSVVTQHRKELAQAVDSVGDENWVRELPALLGIATGIRLTRNEAGHPTPHAVSRDECRNMLGLFPRLAEALFVSARSFDTLSGDTTMDANGRRRT